jgi:SAM-dependent methyltransferase
MPIEFTAHNIRLDDGTLTKPDFPITMEQHPWFISTRRILNTVYPGDKNKLRLADLGCLEGGYSVEFARMGFQVLGLEVRDANIAVCNYVKSKTNLPNLEFAKDDAWNIARHGVFDVVFCCGLLYHLDRPKQFLELLSSVTTKLIIVQTHFSTESEEGRSDKFHLSELSENEGLAGRWYIEYANDQVFNDREASKWSSWDNRRSFWIQREYLIQAIQEVGFDLVLEQYDSLGPNIAESILRGPYFEERRGTFIGVKT